MALTVLSDLLPYEQYIRGGYMEGLDYFVNLFGAGSAGTIRLQTENTTGTLKHEAYFKPFGNISRRDITIDSAQVVNKIERAEHTSFKTFWKYDTESWQWTAFKTSDAMTKEEVMMLIGRSLAEKKMAYSVSQALTIVCAAIGSQATLVVDKATTPANFNVVDIITAQSKFGDAGSNLKALVMHSAVFYPLIKDQTLNYKFDTGAGLVLYGGSPATYGFPVIVTDNPELSYTSGEDTLYNTLFLADSAVTISDNGETSVLAQDMGGYENIKSIFQAEGDMWNKVKGYQLKASASPASNPEASVLADSANWEKWVTSDKLTAGVLIQSAASLSDVTQVINVKVVS